jgi:hypothetical protein
MIDDDAIDRADVLSAAWRIHGGIAAIGALVGLGLDINGLEGPDYFTGDSTAEAGRCLREIYLGYRYAEASFRHFDWPMESSSTLDIGGAVETIERLRAEVSMIQSEADRPIDSATTIDRKILDRISLAARSIRAEISEIDRLRRKA